MTNVFPVQRFAGLDLINDPQEVGAASAVDMLNMDLDRRGRLRTRDGYTNFTASVVGAVVKDIEPYYTIGGTKQLVVGTVGNYYVYDTAGAQVGNALGSTIPRMVRWGSPTAEYVIVVAPSGGGTTLRYWDGATWTASAGPGISTAYGGFGVSPIDNRLLIAGGGTATEASRVRFSNAGDPFTWTATDFVDITPGDGEQITAIVPFRDVVIVFKETKFAVFYSTSIDATGAPIFNYRMVDAGVGCVGPFAFCADATGVYFMDRKGVYRTTGSDPAPVSAALQPLWFGDVPEAYSGSALATQYLSNTVLESFQGRVHCAVTTGASTTNDRLLVFDPITNDWIVWNVPAASMASFRVSNDEELMFGYASGLTHVGRLAPAYTTDAATAISFSYQSGWYDLGVPGQEKVLRRSMLTGTGTITLSRFRDYQTSDTNAAAVTLGASLATEPHPKSWRGTLLSHKLSGTGQMEVRELSHEIRNVRPPGIRSPLS